MSNRYRHIRLKEQISINKIYSFHYNELNKDYVYLGEQHNFWEFLYVDKGEVEITTDFSTFHLKQGDMVFYTPNEFHSLRCNRKTPPNIFIISFDCQSSAMRFFSHKMLRLGNDERLLLSQLIEEGNKLFVMPIVGPHAHPPKKPKHPLTRKEKPEFGAEQMIKIYLEALLIRLIRNNREQTPKPKLSSITKEKGDRELVRRIVDYLEAHMSDHPPLDRLCAEFALSKTQLRAIFREHTGCGITEYVGRLRIERAKQHIREETSNVTEIAEQLGYSSIHYFSRQFKKATGMTPSEYLKTMKAQM
ncbi:HTH-type transcriptional activator RhaR [Paenibacillus solanacearum]|uniref:HTH-type transcriptional activator RhaR n=1 Tax=Paenibacillus solanacearum TaxID=2048548 RepID=A0A916K600_9BACL|nr:AraC family transcriptional regulator [Paenibacillus solanacearum]CAG7646345.1 HTH-type transcriptional activator RhaR [Paenibacillus solanacearum]